MGADLIPMVADEDLHDVDADAALILDEALGLRPLGDDAGGDDDYERSGGDW